MWLIFIDSKTDRLPYVIAAMLILAPVANAATAKPVAVVAAESSYGSMVRLIGGDHVRVTSLLDSPAVDPHRFRASPEIGRRLGRAGLVVMNGLGFDAWMTPLLNATRAPGRHVVKASEAASAMVLASGNPHLFYSPQAMLATASRVAKTLAVIDPAHAAAYRAGLTRFRNRLVPIYRHVQRLIADHPNLSVVATVPVYNYMLELMGYRVRYRDVQFAAMRGSQPSAKQLRRIFKALRQNKIDLLINNVQVHNRLTAQIVSMARKSGVPVVGVSAIPLHGEGYVRWQVAQLAAIEKSLDASGDKP